MSDLEDLRARGLFRPAGVGRGVQHSQSRGVRNDSTYWLNRKSSNSAQTFLWRKIDLLMLAINRSLFLGITDFEGHYAIYPEGGFYQRHRDSFQTDARRVVSFILYLNPNWKPEDGGRLRVYSSDSKGIETYQDVNPVGGTMVCFLSRETEHEVLPSFRQRFSLSGWFRTGPQACGFMSSQSENYYGSACR